MFCLFIGQTEIFQCCNFNLLSKNSQSFLEKNQHTQEVGDRSTNQSINWKLFTEKMMIPTLQMLFWWWQWKQWNFPKRAIYFSFTLFNLMQTCLCDNTETKWIGLIISFLLISNNNSNANKETKWKWIEIWKKEKKRMCTTWMNESNRMLTVDDFSNVRCLHYYHSFIHGPFPTDPKGCFTKKPSIFVDE